MKYKIGDKVRIKNLDWYNENKISDCGLIRCPPTWFGKNHLNFCGKVMTISHVGIDFYIMVEDLVGYWTDEMIECKVEEETKPEPKFKVGDEIISDVLQLKWKVIDVERTGYKLISVNNSELICDMDFKNEQYYKLVEEETKPEPKFKVGDKIKLKSKLLNDIFGVIGYESEGYRITNISNGLTYFMSYSIEHYYELVEEEVGLVDNLSSRWVNEFNLPDGYIFKDQTGNEIHTTKIVLEKANTLKIQSNNMETETHRGYCTTEEETTNKSKKVAWFTFEDNDFADKVELALSNRELIQEDGKWFVVKKKKEYPKTYEECCKVLGCKADHFFTDFSCKGCDVEISDYEDKIDDLLQNFRKLRYCRDAYWKLYGEEMGLGKPWEPDWKNNLQPKYYISTERDEIKTNFNSTTNKVLAFPTPEMRDDFKKNFDPDIKNCKELL